MKRWWVRQPAVKQPIRLCARLARGHLALLCRCASPEIALRWGRLTMVQAAWIDHEDAPAVRGRCL